MSFWNLFKSELPNIVNRLKCIGQDIEDTKNNLARLIAIETQISRVDVATMIDSFNVAIWAKDLSGRFLFANKVCCETILKCSLSEALNLRNGDFKKDSLSRVCVASDNLVIESLRTRRFIEHAVYEDGDVYVDSVKNPMYNLDGELIGVTGSAVIITDIIPEKIKKQTRKSNSIEIPVDATMSSDMFIGFLERRQKDRIIEESQI